MERSEFRRYDYGEYYISGDEITALTYNAAAPLPPGFDYVENSVRAGGWNSSGQFVQKAKILSIKLSEETDIQGMEFTDVAIEPVDLQPYATILSAIIQKEGCHGGVRAVEQAETTVMYVQALKKALKQEKRL